MACSISAFIAHASFFLLLALWLLLLVSMHVSFLFSIWPETYLLAVIIRVKGGTAIENGLHLQITVNVHIHTYIGTYSSTVLLVCTIFLRPNVNLCTS